ncbi:MAG TPA: GNAT family N-acetyltransferase [Actinocrinis sp.]|nr:GNAT family N-acetyltransferase [Actinocrinis sp.]
MPSLRFRAAAADDAPSVAALHADSWRRHYRGAYSDAFLDGDVLKDRRSVWEARLCAPGPYATIMAEDEAGALLGFVHVIFDDDGRWGSLVDNLHVTADHKRSGIGTELMVRAATAVTERARTGAMYLWVLEQNTAAQQFYQAIGGAKGEKTAAAPPPAAVRPGAQPQKFRVSWPDAATVIAARA